MNEKAFKELEIRVTRLEKVIFRDDRKPVRKAGNEDFSGGRGGIRFLISKAFFDEKRTLGEARRAMAENGYYYSRQAVDMALKGLASRKGPLTSLKQGGRNIYVKRK